MSRGQTIVPLFALLAASLLGLVDDFFQIIGKGSYAGDAIIYRKIKIAAVVIIGALIGSWFFYKLGVSSISIPFLGAIDIGFLFIPFFIIVMLAVFSSSVIDGIDGLAGGLMAEVFAAYATIAFFHNQIDLAAFCAVLAGGILAFCGLTFHRQDFIWGDRYSRPHDNSVGRRLSDRLCRRSADYRFSPRRDIFFSHRPNAFQKTARRQKIFIVAPIHHHFEAKGWSRSKITMRYWIIGVIFFRFGNYFSSCRKIVIKNGFLTPVFSNEKQKVDKIFF